MTLLAFDDLRTGRRANLWLDELPYEALLLGNVHRKLITLDGGLASPVMKSVAIEILRPIAGSFQYGLLGMEYDSTQRDALHVSIPVSTTIHRLYGRANAGSLDIVKVGSLPEYAEGLYSGVQSLMIDDRPRGALAFTCMAHGDSGSSPLFFGQLAYALAIFICRPNPPSSYSELRDVLAAGPSRLADNSHSVRTLP